MRAKQVRTIRTIRRLEDVPVGITPSRRVSSHGYVVLTWTIGINELVSCYEHRLVAGFPDGHVHHLDGDTQNNDLSNLQPIELKAHSRIHNQRQFDLDHARALYESGMSMADVARAVGAGFTSILRCFERAGIPIRGYVPKSVCKAGHAMTPENTYRQPSNGSRSCRICRRERIRRQLVAFDEEMPA